MTKPADYQGIQIGEYTLSRWSDTEIAIRHKSGEAGAFEIKKLEKVIHDFFEKEF